MKFSSLSFILYSDLSGISLNFDISGGSCFLIYLDIWDLVELYSGHINPISSNISLYMFWIYIKWD